MAEFNFKPFDKVLVRDSNLDRWECTLYSRYEEGDRFPYRCMGSFFVCCIPYEGNEHLLGTTDPYVEPYEPKDGDFVVSGWERGDRYCHWIAICRDGDNDTKYYSTYAVLHTKYSANSGVEKALEIQDDTCDGQDYTRLATEKEKQLLLSKLAEAGKKWNPEKKKIEDIYQPKDGDFVYVKSVLTGTEYIFIKKVFDGCSLTSHFVLFDVEENALSRVYETCCLDKDIDTIRPATEEEKQLLLDALHKEGNDWDESKKKIMEYKWPRMYNSYAFVTSCGDIRFTIYQNTPDDQERVKIGNCFHNKEEGQPYADKVKELLKGGKK